MSAEPIMSEAVRVSFDPRAEVAQLELLSPTAYGGIRRQNMEETPETIERLGAMPQLKYVVVTSAAPAFCVGGEADFLTELGDLALEERRSILARCQKWATALLDCPCATVAGVNGLVAGAGVDFLLAFDLAFLGPATRINLWYSKLRALPDLGGLALMVERFGRTKALDMYASSQTWDRDAAASLGLGRAVADLPLDAEAWARLLSASWSIDRNAWATAKAMAWARDREPFLAHQEEVAHRQAEIFGSADFQRRISRIAALGGHLHA